MTSAGRLFEIDEIFQEICRHATLATLMKLRRTSKATDQTVRHTLKSEIDHHLEVYADNAQVIWDMMTKSHAVLLGHVPLAIALMNQDARALKSPVLIIATPIGGAELVRRALMDVGYERIMRYRDKREGNRTAAQDPKGERATNQQRKLTERDSPRDRQGERTYRLLQYGEAH